MTLADERPTLQERISLLEGRSRDRSTTPAPSGLTARRWWMVVVALAVMWAWARSLAVTDGWWNPAGLGQLGDFFAAALRPELDPTFLRVVADAALTTAAYAVAGTALALAIGLAGGVLTSEAWWRRDPLDRGGVVRTGRPRSGWLVARALAAVPRGVHEAVIALVLVQVLGRDPLVAVLAIGIPFGAITAKVVAEIIDDNAADADRALRSAGAGRVVALLYGVAPAAGSQVVAYAFYRLECSFRSAAVLGVIGAGGLGFELTLSLQSLQFDEIWTIVYVLVAMSLVADAWAASLRRRPSHRRLRRSGVAGLALTVTALWWLGVHPSTLWSERTRELAGAFTRSAVPPRLPAGGWSELAEAALDTVALGVVAISGASLVAIPLAFAVARHPHAGRLRVSAGATVRVVVLVVRSIPPPVWALVVLYVIRPGPLAGGIALAIGTAAILVRLDTDIVETADRRAGESLVAVGAGPTIATLYGTVPIVAPRLTSMSLYRWEVTTRETVVVGIVGAGGLGRLLSEQTVAFDEAAMLTTIVTLIGLALAVDVLSARLRRVLR